MAAKATRERVDHQVLAISKAPCKGLQDPLESREYRVSMVYLERRVMPAYLDETDTRARRERKETPDTQDSVA